MVRTCRYRTRPYMFNFNQSKEKFLSAVSTGGFGFCSVILYVLALTVQPPYTDLSRSGWDIHDFVYPNELLISNRANGYGDLLAQIDLSTFRRIPWENDVPFFLLSFLNPDTKEPICADPRGVLKKVVEHAQNKGYQPYAGCEYEVSPRWARSLMTYLHPL